jgi:hypothetical protein
MNRGQYGAPTASLIEPNYRETYPALSKTTGQSGLNFGRRQNWHHLELDQIVPVREPFIKQAPIGALHHLIASREVLGDPTANVLQAFRSEPTAFAKTTVHRDRVTTTEVFNDEV